MFYIFFRPFMGFAEEVYTWTDENGVMHFSYSPPELRENFEVEEMLHGAPSEAQQNKGSENKKKQYLKKIRTLGKKG
jgi:uncharacterized protein DUF4124